MGADFIPEKDAEARSWLGQFARTLEENPADFGISILDSEAISAAVQAYDHAYRRAVQPNTRGGSAVFAKNTARREAERICRQFAALIKHNPAVSDQMKFSLGITLPTRHRRRVIAVPETLPVLQVQYAPYGGCHIVTFYDSESGRRAKPFGAASLQLFVRVSESTDFVPAGATFLGSYTKNPIHVPFHGDDPGRYANYAARWMSRRGETGPWSTTRSLRIAA